MNFAKYLLAAAFGMADFWAAQTAGARVSTWWSAGIVPNQRLEALADEQCFRNTRELSGDEFQRILKSAGFDAMEMTKLPEFDCVYSYADGAESANFGRAAIVVDGETILVALYMTLADRLNTTSVPTTMILSNDHTLALN